MSYNGGLFIKKTSHKKQKTKTSHKKQKTLLTGLDKNGKIIYCTNNIIILIHDYCTTENEKSQ